jgi:hypothetical protein
MGIFFNKIKKLFDEGKLRLFFDGKVYKAKVEWLDDYMAGRMPYNRLIFLDCKSYSATICITIFYLNS